MSNSMRGMHEAANLKAESPAGKPTVFLLRALCGAAIFAASISASHAGPCSADIDAMQGRIDAKLEAIAASGKFAPQGISAGMSDQPTPHSIAAAEVRLGEIKRVTVRTIRRAMSRARAADAAGKERRCNRELAVVARLLGP